MKKSKKRLLEDVVREIKEMKPCPFCGCRVGIYISPDWGFQWHGKHREPCILEYNPSAYYGKIDVAIEEWNKRK
jgi:hypothetical protein